MEEKHNIIHKRGVIFMTNLDKITHKLMDNNHRLKAKCGLMEKEIERLSEENEQLKEILGFLKNDNTNAIINPTTFVLNLQQSTIKELTKENEQLKERLKKNCPGIVWRDLE